MKTEDIRIETYTSSSPKITIRMFHIPTGVHVEETGISSYVIKNELIKKLEMKIKKLWLA